LWYWYTTVYRMTTFRFCCSLIGGLAEYVFFAKFSKLRGSGEMLATATNGTVSTAAAATTTTTIN
jgi:hypothetical protein